MTFLREGASSVGSPAYAAWMDCPVCGHPLPLGAHFCPNCGAVVGTPLGTEERKMVTVLFADLVDSTGLAQRLDPERAREVLGRFFDAATEELQALRGRPEKFIGDAVMAVFGLPTVHEDDALRAVRAGLAIRGRLRRLGSALGLTEPLQVRVGIESGVGATGLGPAGQLLVTGQVVNAAARLQTAAGPGEVLAGETTQTLTDSEVAFGGRRNIRAKGFTLDLAAYPVEGLTTRSARRTIPLVGRSSELTILRECLAHATATGKPALVTIVGEAGIGKSRLADELVACLDEEVTVLIARARSHGETSTFAPLAAVVGDLAQIDDGDTPDKVRQRLRESAGRYVGPHEIDRVTDRLGLLFGVSERRDESTFVHDVHAGFLALVDGVAAAEPLVMVVEDIHTLSGSMLDLVERTGARPRGGERRSLTLALTRPEFLDERPTWGSNAVNAVLLRMDPLSTEEALDLARQAGGGRITEDEATEIAKRTGGNPFFIVETTGMLLPESDGRPRRMRGALPPTVQAVVTARLDALPTRLRTLARCASVFRFSFELEELIDIDPDATVHELHELEDAEIVVREEGVGALRWRMRHATLRDVAYGSLPKRERVRLHEIIADRLISSGHHSFASEHLELAALASLDLDPLDRRLADRAVDELIQAGDRARRRMVSRAAVDLYERALALAGPEETWAVREARALGGLGESRYWLGEYDVATVKLERAVTLGEAHHDPFAMALALRFLGDIAINVDADLEKAEALLDRSLIAAEELGDPWAITRTLLFAGWVPWTRDRYPEAEAIWQRALDVADPDDLWARIRALTALSINRDSMGDLEQALRLIDDAVPLADDAGDLFSVAVVTVQRARVIEDLGRMEEALLAIERAVAIFEELGARWELADALAERGILKRELGRLDEAEDDLRLAIGISEELGERQIAGWTWTALAHVAERRGDEAEARERFRRAEEAQARRPR
jgi:class 3 adenylate cyclase/tetratricopeptide (TPR) repeat protein